jgi:hypothetical protein
VPKNNGTPFAIGFDVSPLLTRVYNKFAGENFVPNFYGIVFAV